MRAVRPPAARGVNVLGYLTAELGVGEAARQLVGSLSASQCPHATIVLDRTSSRLGHPFEDHGLEAARYDVNLICMNPDALPELARDLGPTLFADRTNIGLWWWEVTELPAACQRAFSLVDEVWVGSAFVQRALHDASSTPVWAFPMPVEFRESPRRPRCDLGLPEGFLFLFSFDYFSTAARKNPLGVVDAFCRAFADGEGPQLVVKSINGDHHRVELEELRARARERSDVTIIDGYLKPEDKDALMASCDAYVSLHRSEGFGLTLAQAMWAGKPTVATAYGGNTEFMTEENAYLVPYALAPVGPDASPYPANGTWAEPIVGKAAQLLRRIVDRPDEAAERARRGQRELRARHAPARVGRIIAERLDLLRAARAVAGSPGSPREASVLRGTLEGPELPIDLAPLTPWDSPSRFGVVGRSGRRLLHRVLRPYEHRQRELDEALIVALRDVSRRTDEIELALRSYETTPGVGARATDELPSGRRDAHPLPDGRP
jgi:glycosyltransferase involved in cell wall biosynthesis